MRLLRVVMLLRWVIAVVLMTGTSAVVSHAPILEIQIVGGGSCVEPVEIMRRDHMDMLMHQRDDTVIGGIRTSKHSLLGCIDCHANRDAEDKFIRVDAPGQFCSTCHEYVAVEMDCFGCHAAVPQPEDNASIPRDRFERMIVTPDAHYPWLASMHVLGGADD